MVFAILEPYGTRFFAHFSVSYPTKHVFSQTDPTSMPYPKASLFNLVQVYSLLKDCEAE